MNQAEIFTLSRLNTSTNSTNLPDDTLLSITNITYRDLINKIVSRVNEDFFYDEWTANFVLGQREYTLPVRTSSVAWLKKITSIGVKYKPTDEYFRITEPNKFSNLTKDATYYQENISDTTPLFNVADKSVFIYPLPTETVTNWLILYWISDPIDMRMGDSEADIKIPVDYHHLIVLGNEYRIYKARRMTAEKNDALIEYNNEIEKMVTELSDRIIRPLESVLPYLWHLE